MFDCFIVLFDYFVVGGVLWGVEYDLGMVLAC